MGVMNKAVLYCYRNVVITKHTHGTFFNNNYVVVPITVTNEL